MLFLLCFRDIVDGLTPLQDAAESSDSDEDDEPQYRSVRPAARRQHDERKATSVSDHSENEDATPSSDHDIQDEPIRAPVVQPKPSISSVAPSASDALSKKSLGGRFFLEPHFLEQLVSV